MYMRTALMITIHIEASIMLLFYLFMGWVEIYVLRGGICTAAFKYYIAAVLRVGDAANIVNINALFAYTFCYSCET